MDDFFKTHAKNVVRFKREPLDGVEAKCYEYHDNMMVGCSIFMYVYVHVHMYRYTCTLMYVSVC